MGKYITLMLVLIFITGCQSQVKESQVEEFLVSEEEWQLVFQDEFDGERLDTTVWSHQLGTGSQYGLTGWGNDEAQYYLEENANVSDGTLVISALRQTHKGMAYTSSRIRTKDGFSKAYGRFEARISFPIGDGLWPAFWMLPQEEVYGTWAASGEIDIVEVRGRLPMDVSGALHFGGVWPNNEFISGHHKLEESVESYHVYAIEWEPDEIRWYVDDVLYHISNEWFSVSEGEANNNTYPAPFDQPFYMILNLAVGGRFDDYRLPDDDFEEAKMKVDYVRVYEARN